MTFLKAMRRSDAVMIGVVFLIVDLMFRTIISVGAPSIRFDEPYRSRIWWAVQDLNTQPHTADLILLGASDMVCAMYGAEATLLKTSVSQLLSHRSQYLEQRLKESNAPCKTVFSLAIPGEMPCDAYFLIKTLFAEKPKPKAIFFSVTVRDFCDATFGDPSTTDIFKVMSKLGGTKEYELPCRSVFWDRVDYQFGQILAVHGHKWELMSWQHHIVQTLLSKLIPQDFNNISTTKEIRKMSLRDLPEDFGPLEVCTDPFDPKNATFKNNLDEYVARYGHFKQATFTQQLDFFRKLCEFCRADGITLIVANTPVTSENRALIPKQVYDLYFTKVSETVKNSGGIFVDFDKAELFNHDDFFDTIHVNGRGGQKFMDQIALTLAANSRLASSNKPAGE